MKSDFIPGKRGRFHYLKWGKGEQVVLAFHGFGRRAKYFKTLGEAMEKQCTIYAVDLPLHGLTSWAFPDFQPSDLAELVQKIQAREGVKKIWGLGHSLGGRLWLTLLSQMAPALHGLLLIAPDGFRTRGVDEAMILPLWLRDALIKKMRRPNQLLQIANWANQANILRKPQYRFMEHHLKNEQKRERVIRVWTSLRFFKPDAKVIRQVCQNHQLPIHVLLGKNDPIIPEKKLTRRLAKQPTMRISYTEGGHAPRHKEAVEWMSEIIK